MGGEGGGMADQVVSSALRYRAQAPLLDAMLSEIGLKAGDPQAMADALRGVTDANGSEEIVTQD
jgi:hypothetical protein